MADTQAVRQAIRSRIKTQLIDPHPDVALWLFREQVQESAPPTGKHVIIDLPPAHARQVSTGSPRLLRWRGVLVFRIATPIDEGAGPNEAIAALIEPHFKLLLDTNVDPPIRYYAPVWAPAEVPGETSFIGRLVVDWQADTNEV